MHIKVTPVLQETAVARVSNTNTKHQATMSLLTKPFKAAKGFVKNPAKRIAKDVSNIAKGVRNGTIPRISVHFK